jgi:glycosyltransferase involved in cell wall biosynthesis
MLRVSIVTPTFYRHLEIPDYLKSIQEQFETPLEIIIIDGAPLDEKNTENLIKSYCKESSLPIQYYRKTGGTAIQRNFGITKCIGDIILFLDDDVRIFPNFIRTIRLIFEQDVERKIGGITGYRENCYFDMTKNTRWIWYKRLRLLKEFTPGKYDYQTGYPINNNGMHPFSGIREVDFMTTACTAYRSNILKKVVNFDPFFVGYGILEDAHLALTIKSKGYILLQSGDAKCIELSAKSGRTNRKIIGERTVVNYYYVFNSIAGPLSFIQKFRFFRYQLFELFRAFLDIIRFRNYDSIEYFHGKINGIIKVIGFKFK